MSIIPTRKEDSIHMTNFTNISYILRKIEPLEINPQEIYFKDIQVNQTYEIPLQIRNLTKKPRRIRIFQPQTQFFRADYEIQGQIPAGLAVRVIVTFETTILDNYKDELKIISENQFTKTINLFAYKACAFLIYEPFINFGFCKIQEGKKEKIYFKNEGSQIAKVELKSNDPQNLVLVPSLFTIKPSKEMAINAIYTPQEAGLYRGIIEVNSDAECLQKQIEINATCVEFKQFITDEKGIESSQLDLGTFYFGQALKTTCFLVNNTPQRMKFTSSFRSGIIYSGDDNNSLLTPHQIGKELTEKILSVEPCEGFVDEYSQIKLIITFQAQVLPKNKFWSQSYAISGDDMLPEVEDYAYSAVFQYENCNLQPTILHLTGRGICPTVKIEKSLIQFGICPVNEYRDVQFYVQNKNKVLPVDIQFKKIPYFEVLPGQCVLQGSENQTFIGRFTPKAIGKFDRFFDVFLIGGAYQLQIKVKGRAISISNKKQIKRGHENVFPESFQKEIQLVNDNDFIQQNLRIKQQQQQQQQQQNLNQDSSSDEDLDIKAKFKKAPIDFAYEVGMVENRIDSPQLQLPVVDEQLYVNKPIGKYLPLKKFEDQTIFNPDPNQSLKKRWPSKPQNHKEIREISKYLDGSELQKIYAGPVYIQFDAVYVNSTIQKTFFIKNDLRTSISVRLQSDQQELKKTSQKMQIIPPNQIGGFDIILESQILGQFKSNIKYIINESHVFEFQILADIQMVKLDLSKNNIKFQFYDDNHEMITKESIKLCNNGNASAKFEFLANQSKIFTVEPEKGEVEAHGSINVNVIYHPSQNNTHSHEIIRQEEEKLTLKVKDGLDTFIKCQGIVQDAKCVIQKGNNLDLKQVCVAKEEIRTFNIKNQSRNQAVFYIQNLPEFVQVLPVKGRIGPEESKEIQVKFVCFEEKNIKDDIIICIRGGKILKVPFKVECIIPEVSIFEKEINFGNVTTLGSPSVLKMTLINNSNIAVDLQFDMRSKEENPNAELGIECLEINLENQEDESAITSVHEDQENENLQQSEQKDEDDEDQEQNGPMNNNENLSEYDSSDGENQQKKKSKIYNLNLLPNKQMSFLLKFAPKEVLQYNFKIPIRIFKFGTIPNLERYVLCRGLYPKFLVDPQVCEFKKKIITTPDKCFADEIEINLNNPGRQNIQWRIDISKIGQEKIFNIEPNSGIVEANQVQIIKAYFNPYAPDKYNIYLPLFIENDDEISNQVPYVEIELKGESSFPRLLFDRKEIILPVVPLEINSKCIFRIINDGYDNINLKYKIIQDIQALNIQINWIEGKNLGISKQRIKVEVVFSSKKPISFSTRIEFNDDQENVYPIIISGTSDNCLFSNYGYFQRSYGDYKLKLKDGNGNIIVQEEEDDLISQDGQQNRNKRKLGTSVQSYSSTKSQAQALGYYPIPKVLLDKSIEYITRWLNYNILQSPIKKFPSCIIEHNGSQIFELIFFLTGNNQCQSLKANINSLLPKNEQIQKIYKQYDDLLRFLKKEGAFLNHIRPEYLLSYRDYVIFIKFLPSQLISTVSQSGIMLSQNTFLYLQIDAWITVFYQILKIYFLNRVNTKNFKLIQGIPSDKLTIPDYIQNSNALSTSESLVIYWIECIFQRKNNTRLINLEQDLKDGIFMQALLVNYLGKVAQNALIELKKDCFSYQDCNSNCEKIVEAIQKIGINSYIKPQDLSSPLMRELMLFCLQMMHSLPHYIPKINPIIFSCVLGEEVIRNIILSNPTNRIISYQVRMEGSNHFKMESDENFAIEPKSTASFKVKFTSKVSDVVTGRIFFNNKKQSNVQAAALVFDLKSQITSRVSEKILEFQSYLYEVEEIQIPITNKYDNDGKFQVIIMQVKPQEEQQENYKKKRQKQQKEKPKQQQEQKNQQEEIFPSFFCRQYISKKMNISKGSTINLSLVTIPLVMKTQRCFIIFKDPDLGEFQYEIIVKVNLPLINQDILKIQKNIFVDEAQNLHVQITNQNEQMKKARKLIEQLLQERNKEKFIPNQKNISFKTNEKIAFPGGNPEITTYNVCLNPIVTFLQVPQKFQIKNIYVQARSSLTEKNLLLKRNKEKQQNPEEESQALVYYNQFPLNFLFKNAVKDYQLELIFQNEEKTDIRRYKLEFTSIPKPIQATLEFRVPARMSGTQEIPIVNNTEKDWIIKVQFQKDKYENSHLFSCPPSFNKEFIVKKKSQGSFPITFSPKWIQDGECKLILTNTFTNELYEYQIKGFGEEPVSEGHIVVNCTVRETYMQEIIVQNPFLDQDVQFQVETDLLYAKGDPFLKIKSGQKSTYKLSFCPILSGQYTGSITFISKDGSYLWYTILVNTQSQQADSIIDMNTFIRQQCNFEILLENPLDKEVIFDVVIKGGNCLIGDPTFILYAKESACYTLTFSPIFVGKEKASIMFSNALLGEKWFELNLISEDVLPVKLPILKTELGKFSTHKLELENPTLNQVKAFVKCSNLDNFEIFPKDIILQPLKVTTVYLNHYPSSLEQVEQADITIYTQEIGKWIYLASGSGVQPQVFEKKKIQININKDYTSTINFKNPFKQQITVQVYMEKSGFNKHAFKLLFVGKKQFLKNNQDDEECYQFTISAQETLSIPFSFIPTQIMQYHALIVVSFNDKIFWKYPLEGSTQCNQQLVIQSFKTKCREIIDEEFTVNLPGIININDNQNNENNNDTFTFELKGIENEYQSLVQKCLQIKITKNHLNSPNDSLEFSTKFNPLKPFKTRLEFHIIRIQGGRWRYFLDLEATEPDFDDTIIISSELNKTTSVSFKLTNKAKQFTPFIADFTPDSDTQFTVFPKQGVLEGYGREGTNFIVSFTPIEYGNFKNAKLIIQTEDMYWSYIIKGKLPKYQPPQADISIIDNKLESRLDNRILQNYNSKNYMLNNIKKTKQINISHNNEDQSTNLISSINISNSYLVNK
ncbi:hypothetical protein IMG5_201370 [Ichthyophthirius multifiliis]|uniref:Calponin-homology (CH) domain-containing protein n=1 Tax=Ichthyophthirius multifiliis TaxID=5932 RepID=G0R5Z1_ICHMU|nr:hypothetical protein IMG5_201370 [Ichthyophthirius multifiliis]EGR27115.1 hypothetical protein IMG5_201370 [Ichthyophthirius multifiliis]|eukprot:XP_004023999.1 hypothetical protein IMG5_201370 [Ichthyophthirius multifiliis]